MDAVSSYAPMLDNEGTPVNNAHPILLEVEVVEAVCIGQEGHVGPQEVSRHWLDLVEPLGCPGSCCKGCCKSTMTPQLRNEPSGGMSRRTLHNGGHQSVDTAVDIA